ncbi:hypothetical protein TIFTF001_007819 [Ficus carica]|uniref:Uncharacterized protein n=1 Tax=Ficus carica TaxID=3494 RepID=A0AA87ZRW9_FICCA|nr:hypothetical protein TIFTF001_007819 [Ficus carica]
MLMLMTWEITIGYGVGEYSGTRRKSSREICGKQRREGRVKREREWGKTGIWEGGGRVETLGHC